MDLFNLNYWCSAPSDVTFTSDDGSDDISTLSPSAQIYYHELNQQVQLFNAPNEHGWLSSDIDVANKCKDPSFSAWSYALGGITNFVLSISSGVS